jgi:S-adenosyl-L-methionine hydrolase (adenosine-forming)
MAIITLTTDWNKSDYYIGSLKGKILSLDESINIVDISHQVLPFNIMHAAFILRNCCFEFPKGTIHIIAVNAALTEKRPLIVISNKDHFFITSDNGIAGLLFGDKPDVVYKVTLPGIENNFNGLNKFIDTAYKIIKGESFNTFCEIYENYITQIPLRPVIEKKLISGSIIYIDSFSNAISNISLDTFKQVGEGLPFEIFVQSNHYRVDRLSNTYSDAPSGELLALFNSVGLLEIAINNGYAADLLNLKTNSAIRIKFYDDKPGNNLNLTGE